MMVILRSIFLLWLCTSGTSVNWAELVDAGDTPGARQDHSMTALADGTAVLFGGYNGEDFLDDVYSLTLSGPMASWTSLDSQGDTPSARYQHSMTTLADGTAVLFGGNGYYNGYLNDVYALFVSGTTASWTSLASQGDTPSARYRHSMTALADGTAVLFGGSYYYDYVHIKLDDVYSLTVSAPTASWTSLSSHGDTPSARDGHSMTRLADGRVVLFGGRRDDVLDDVYTLSVSGTTASWTSLASQGATPSARYGHSMTALADGTEVLFGGWASSSNYLDGFLDDVKTMTVPTPPPTASPTASPTPTPSPTTSPIPPSATSNSTTFSSPSSTPSDEVSASEHQHLFLSFLLLELLAAS